MISGGILMYPMEWVNLRSASLEIDTFESAPIHIPYSHFKMP